MTQSPFDVIKNDYTIEELNDIVEHGCASGCANNHIYYKDTVSFYDQYSDDIVEYITDVIGSEFLTETFDNNEGNLTGYKNDIVWTFIELYAMELIDNIDNEEIGDSEIKYNLPFDDEVNNHLDKLTALSNTEWGKDHLEIVNPTVGSSFFNYTIK